MSGQSRIPGALRWLLARAIPPPQHEPRFVGAAVQDPARFRRDRRELAPEGFERRTDTLRVRADTGPFAGQLQQSQPGFATQPFSVPLRLRTPNAI